MKIVLAIFTMVLMASAAPHIDPSDLNATDAATHQKLRFLADPSAKVTVLPGIPRGKVPSESATKIGAHYFRSQSIDFGDADKRRIFELFDDARFHNPHQDKFCGGFHPDFVMICDDGRNILKIMVCLTCHEWKASDGKIVLYTDIAAGAIPEIKTIWKRYSRPTTG